METGRKARDNDDMSVRVWAFILVMQPTERANPPYLYHTHQEQEVVGLRTTYFDDNSLSTRKAYVCEPFYPLNTDRFSWKKRSRLTESAPPQMKDAIHPLHLGRQHTS